MRLSFVSVQNFRAIGDVPLKFNTQRFTSLIGPNNAGKSSLLRAISLSLGNEKPELDEWPRGDHTKTIEVILTFTDLADWERNTPGVAGLVHDGGIKLRWQAQVVVEKDKPKIVTSYAAYIPEEVIEGYSDSWSGITSNEIKAIAQELSINGTSWRTAANRERVKELLRQRHPELVEVKDAKWVSDGISIAPALQQALPQAVLIPAVEDASSATKPTATTAFGLLLRKALLPAISKTDQYKAIQENIKALQELLESEAGLPAAKEISEALSQRLSDLIAAKAVLTMTAPDAQGFLAPAVGIRVDDGFSTSVALQGQGVQRALVFALLEVLASKDAVLGSQEEGNERTRSTLLLFEEPELYIHPHLMRKLRHLLKGVSSKDSWQVVVTTHSPFLVDVGDDPTSLVILRRPDPKHPPTATQLSDDPFVGEAQPEREALRASIDFHPTTCEAFFAKHTVLVEGDTEIAILSERRRLCTAAGLAERDGDEVTVVSCGGKWTIAAMARLMVKFGIPVRVVHDRDAKDRPQHELDNCDAIDPYRANARIAAIAGDSNTYVCDDTVEHLLSATPPSKDKPYRAWRQVRAALDGGTVFDEMPKLRPLVEFVYKPW